MVIACFLLAVIRKCLRCGAPYVAPACICLHPPLAAAAQTQSGEARRLWAGDALRCAQKGRGDFRFSPQAPLDSPSPLQTTRVATLDPWAVYATAHTTPGPGP